MAEVTTSNNVWSQISLVILLRWQTFRNGMRSQSEKMHMLGSAAIGIFFTMLTIGGSIGLGVVTFEIVGMQKWVYLSAILWGIFLFWQFVPVLASQTNPGFDGRNLLRFPIKFSTFFLMSTAYGLADPFALAAILWHISIGIAISIARPDLRLWAALALACSVLMNLLFNRMLFAWLERFLARRRTREVVTALFILFFVCIQFSGLILQRWGPAVKSAFESSANVWRSLPPALAGTAIERASENDFASALMTIGTLALYVIAFGGLFAFRAHPQFTGEDLGESAAPVRKIGGSARACFGAVFRRSFCERFWIHQRAGGGHFQQGIQISIPKFDAIDEYIYAPDFYCVYRVCPSMPSRHGGGSPLRKIQRWFRVSRSSRLSVSAHHEFLPQ